MSTFEKKSILQLIKFGIVGVLNTLVDLIVTGLMQRLFALLTTAVILTYYIPKVIGYGCGILNSYILNSGWTFKEERRRDAREILSFLAVNLITLGLSLLMMWLFRNCLGLDAWWSETVRDSLLGRIISGDFFCTVLSSAIALIINFLGNKLFVFHRKDPAEEET